MARIRFSYQAAKKPADVRGKDVVAIEMTPHAETEVITRDNKQKTIRFGAGKAAAMTRRKFFTLCRRSITLAKANKAKRAALSFGDFSFSKTLMPPEEQAFQMAVNFEMANFDFVRFKTPPKDGWRTIKEVIVCGKLPASARRGFHRGSVLGEDVNVSRSLANTPGGDMTPGILAREAKKNTRGTRIKARILGKKEMQKLKMGAVLGVAQGSKEEPKFIILEYRGGKKNERPVVLVGKGVTFDTGGLNLKTGDSILDMHLDMSGGAAVIGAVRAAARLKLKKNVVGLIPAVENMPSGESYRPGDILRSMSGKTIEVLNTDAEGRVILADALSYAKKYNPRLVVDVATLTGAALVALGQHASAIMTRDRKLEKLFRKLGEESGDYVWPFPLWNEYEESVRGNFGDVANIPASGNTRYAGVINGGMFLYQFTKSSPSDGSDSAAPAYPWVHIDIAPRMVAAPNEHLSKGSAGAPVRLLVKLIERY